MEEIAMPPQGGRGCIAAGDVSRKYAPYKLKVDEDQDDKATELKLNCFARPHMRAFHCSWWSFFIAFFIWFAIPPLFPEIKKTLELTKSQIWMSNIFSVAGTVVMRFSLGPLCDKYGARLIMAMVLCAASIPTALTFLVNSSVGLTVLRLFIGTAGSCFVMCQYWTSRMFTKEIVGTANALVGGWGNLGGGVTQLVMGSVLFPIFKAASDDAEIAWRYSSIVPAVVAFTTGLVIFNISDDCPRGNYSKLKKTGEMPEVSAAASFRSGSLDFNTWILFIQYACCFGVELTMNNAAALYFNEQFGQSTEAAAAIASIFGWMNIFARPIGGFISDKSNSIGGMKGRLMWQTFCLVAEGILIIIFAHATNNLGTSIFVLIIFSILVQAAEGSTFGIVPYVNPPCTGSIAGIVGAGGNVGAVCFSLAFRQLPTTKEAFVVMGITVICSSILSVCIAIQGHEGLLTGKELSNDDTIADVLTVPSQMSIEEVGSVVAKHDDCPA